MSEGSGTLVEAGGYSIEEGAGRLDNRGNEPATPVKNWDCLRFFSFHPCYDPETRKVILIIAVPDQSGTLQTSPEYVDCIARDAQGNITLWQCIKTDKGLSATRLNKSLPWSCLAFVLRGCSVTLDQQGARKGYLRKALEPDWHSPSFTPEEIETYAGFFLGMRWRDINNLPKAERMSVIYDETTGAYDTENPPAIKKAATWGPGDEGGKSSRQKTPAAARSLRPPSPTLVRSKTARAHVPLRPQRRQPNPPGMPAIT